LKQERQRRLAVAATKIQSRFRQHRAIKVGGGRWR
jgi:hypothetical protein